MADEGSTVGSSSRQVIGESSESTIEINIKTLDSNIYTFRVDRDMPIPALKSMLANATGVPVERQRLIFRGKVLKDDHLLSEYHLEDGHTLHLVARQPQVQPSPGTGSEGSAHDNINRGNDSTAGAPRHRIGQVSHSVVLGTVNIAEQGESMVADVGRLVGAVLNSLGVGSLASTGQAANPSTTPNQIPSNVETEGTQNASGRTLPSNPAPAGFAILNQPFRPVHQIPQFLSAGSLPRQMVIPDSLVTLSEFINRMELALQNGASQSSPPTNVRDPQRSEVPSSNVSSLPTPEMLRSVMERAQQLLRGDAAAALSHVATHLETEGNSTDPLVRGQLQAEAMHVGAAMQHLGAMLLELGRTIMLLRVGQSPGEASVNAGPAVYISPTGPNPIMVQPFPLQANSLFGVSSSPSFGGVSGPFASGDPSRNVNIHIHAGSSIAPGVSFTATRASSGEAVHGERPNSEPASRNDNGSGGSAPSHGLPSRTDVAAIPARSTAETAGHVLNVIYPVQVRSQLSVPMHSAAAQGSHPTVSSGMQPNTAVVVPQPSSESNSVPAIVAQISAQLAGAFSQIPHSLQSASTQGLHPSPVQGEQSDRGSGMQPNTHVVASQPSSESNTIPAIVAQISAQLASALGGNAQGQIPHIAQYTNTEGPHPTPAHGEQPDRGSALSQTSPEPISSFVTQINAQIANALSLDNHGQSSAPGVLSSDTLSMRGPILPGSMSSVLGSENVNDHGGSVLNIEDGRSVVVNSQVPDVNLHGNDGQQLQSESLHSNNLDSRGTSGMEEDSSASSISSASAICQPRDAVLNKSAVESSENTADSAAAILASLASHSSGSETQAPLGLGIGGLEPKRRGKSAKSVGKDKVPCGTPTINQNQQSISMGQQFLQSLASQSSDVNGENANNLSNTSLSVGDQSMDGMPLERQGGSGQVDIAEMMSHALQSPAFNNLLTGVAARAGVGSSGDFRSMLEQCTQSPVVRSTLNEIAQQVEGQTQGIGAMLSGFGRGQGGIDFSRMIQQMMPAVSQALGRGSARSAPVPTLQAVHQPQCNDASAGRDEGLDVRNSQVDLQQAVERIEEHSAQGDVFRAVLESASHLSGEGNSFEDLVNEFADSAELTNEFIKMLSRDLHRRLQRDPTSED